MGVFNANMDIFEARLGASLTFPTTFAGILGKRTSSVRNRR